MRELELSIKLENNQVIAFRRSVSSENYYVTLMDKDSELISDVEIDESNFDKINKFHADITGKIDRIIMYDSNNSLGYFPPVILEEQVKILEWAQGLLAEGVPFFKIIESLLSTENTNNYASSIEVRNIYRKYNESWKDHILKAILLKAYRLDTDIKAGQLVTDGVHIGYAHYLDYRTRRFYLFSRNDGNGRPVDERQFNIDDFRKY